MFAKITTPNTKLPFEIELLRSYCRVLDSSADDKLTDLALSAMELIGDMTSRSILPQTLTYTLDTFGKSRRPDDDFWYAPQPYGPRISQIISLPRPPLISVTTVKYYDSGNVQRTLALNTDYRVDTAHDPGRIEPVDMWPPTYDKMNAVEIVYIGGYADENAVPLRLSQAIKQLTAYWYDNPDAIGTFPVGLSALTDDYVVRYA